MAGGQILAFPIDIDRRPHNTLALPCECVINGHSSNTSREQNHQLPHDFAGKGVLNVLGGVPPK